MKFNRIFLSVFLIINNIKGMELPVPAELEEASESSALTPRSRNFLSAISNNDAGEFERLIQKNVLKKKRLNDLLVYAIDNLLIGHKDPRVAKARLKIVKILLDKGANANYLKDGVPLIVYAVKHFITNMTSKQQSDGKIAKLIQLLIKYNADVRMKFYDSLGKKINVMIFINTLYNQYWRDFQKKPWVLELKEITDFLSHIYIQTLSSNSNFKLIRIFSL